MLIVFVTMSCSSYKKMPSYPSAVKHLPKSDMMDYATIEFDRGEIQLSEMDRTHLNELLAKIEESGKTIDDIKILTWSDRANKKDTEASNSEIILARQRAESIKTYITNALKEDEDIDFYNMSENPERFNRYMERKGVSVGNAFKNESGTTNPSGRGLVIIEYKTAPASSVI
jgi:hypothetical protein